MIEPGYLYKMAEYNAWMNTRLYEAAGRLDSDELNRDRSAFFGSIIGTLNHLAVADTIWLRRFAQSFPSHAALEAVSELPVPAALNTLLFTDFAELRRYRQKLDGLINTWVSELTQGDLSHILHYMSMQGIPSDKPLGSVLMHFFNHQTHHRGQVTTLLTQAGQDVGATDLLVLISNVEPIEPSNRIQTEQS